MKLKYKYAPSQLINNVEFHGTTLDSSKFYRLNNIERLNRLLAIGYDKQYAVMVFELLAFDSEKLSKLLVSLKKSDYYYAKLTREDHTLLLLVMDDYDYGVNIVEAVASDYTHTLYANLCCDDVDLEAVSFSVYQLAQHTTDKTLRKEKQYSCSDLSDSEKKKIFKLVKKPVIFSIEEEV